MIFSLFEGSLCSQVHGEDSKKTDAAHEVDLLSYTWQEKKKGTYDYGWKPAVLIANSERDRTRKRWTLNKKQARPKISGLGITAGPNPYTGPSGRRRD